MTDIFDYGEDGEKKYVGSTDGDIFYCTQVLFNNLNGFALSEYIINFLTEKKIKTIIYTDKKSELKYKCPLEYYRNPNFYKELKLRGWKKIQHVVDIDLMKEVKND